MSVFFKTEQDLINCIDLVYGIKVRLDHIDQFSLETIANIARNIGYQTDYYYDDNITPMQISHFTGEKFDCLLMHGGELVDESEAEFQYEDNGLCIPKNNNGFYEYIVDLITGHNKASEKFYSTLIEEYISVENQIKQFSANYYDDNEINEQIERYFNSIAENLFDNKEIVMLTGTLSECKDIYGTEVIKDYLK